MSCKVAFAVVSLVLLVDEALFPAATKRLTALISSARVTTLLAKTKSKAMIVRIRIAFRVRKASNVKTLVI